MYTLKITFKLFLIIEFMNLKWYVHVKVKWDFSKSERYCKKIFNQRYELNYNE